MKKFYCLFALATMVLAGLNYKASAQATPTCTTLITSWEPGVEPTDYTYGANRFTITGYSGSNLNDPSIQTAINTNSGYALRWPTIPTVNMQQGGVYATSVFWNINSIHQFEEVWIDFNDDGVFSNSEAVAPILGWNPITTPNPTNFNITIPATGTPGVHLMRMRAIWEVNATDIGANPAFVDPCLFQYTTVNPQYWSGTCTDYYVNIISPCPFTISATNSGPTCFGGNVTLTGATTAPTYTWTGPSGYSSTSLISTITGITAAQAGVYTFTATNGSCTTYVTTNVSLLPSPTTPTVTPTSSSICNGGSVMLTSTGTGGACAPTPILSENFNAIALAAGWSITNSAGGPTTYFRLRTPPGYTGGSAPLGGVPGDGTRYVEASPDALVGTDTWTILNSPTFSTVGYTSATLTFNQYLENWVDDYIVDVEYSLDGGATWAVLQNQTGFSGQIWGATSWTAAVPNQTVALPAAALGVPSVKLRWSYSSNWGYFWAIDNVLVTGTGIGSNISWTPATYLYTDPAFTIPYIAGTITNTVYVHPTTVTVPTVVTYSAVATSACVACTSYGTATVTINPGAAPISGLTTVCAGTTTTLTDATPGGTWSSSAGTGSVGIGSATGIMTGGTAGTATVTYTMPGGCYTTTTVTVTAMPTAILGPSIVCSGQFINLSDPVAGGTWSSSNPAAGTVNAATGVVAGVGSGVTTISYAFSPTCYQVASVTVNPLAPISGASSVCAGLSTTLSDAVPGGTWSSSIAGVLAIGSSSGAITGLTPGTTTIIYTTPLNCVATMAFTVNPSPLAITGTSALCLGQVTTMSDATAGGSWSSSVPTVASIGSGTGFTQALAAGTTTIIYTLPAGCTSIMTLTVNPVPGPISGNPTVCSGINDTLSDATPSGLWSSSNPGIAGIGAGTGIATGVTPGTTTITYLLGTGCSTTTVLTVNPSPLAIVGNHNMCIGLTTLLTDPSAGGSWSSSDITIATIGTGTGLALGIANGTSVITYTLSAGCTAITTVTVNPLPGAINGTTNGCIGFSTTLTDATPGGNWSSSNIAIATIGSATGVVNALSAGNTTMTFTLATTGCYSTMLFTVNPPPAPISGAPFICVGSSSIFTDASGGGAWSSNNLPVATIGSSSGVANGVMAGTATISYTLASTGCYRTYPLTITTPPTAISGPGTVCASYNVALSDGTPGGLWSVTSGSGTASVGSASGIVTGLTSGTAVVSYTTFACPQVAHVMTINPLPAPINGPGSVCAGSSTTLTDATPGGVWSASGASVGSTGIVSGLVVGVPATVTYTLPVTGCYQLAPVSVSPLPDSIRGIGNICPGSYIVLSDDSLGGVWTSSDGTIAEAIAATGQINGLAPGSVTISYTLVSGCYQIQTMNVLTPLPAFLDVTFTPADIFLCHNTPVTLTPHPTNGGVPSYEWKLFGAHFSFDSVLTYNPTHGDFLTCVMTTHGVCASPAVVAKDVVLNVWPLGGPIVDVTCSQGDTISYLGEEYTFYSLVTFGGTSPMYQWFINGVAVPGATSPVFTTRIYADNEYVYCQVTGNSPCDTGSFTGTSNGLLVHGLGYLSVGTISGGNSLTLFPNPNNGSFVLSGTIKSAIDKEVTMEVVDMLGRTVYTGKTMPDNGTVHAQIKLDNEAEGSYLLRVSTDSGNQAFHFVIGK